MSWHFCLGHPTFNIWNTYFLIFFLKLIFLPCLVMYVFGQNSIESPFPDNHINQPNLSLLSIVMFRNHLRSLPPLANSGLLETTPCLTWVFLIFNKSKVTSTFWNFYHTVKTQFNAKIAILCSDNGCEFQNHTLNEFLSSKGIVHQSSYAYTPQQNGVAERKNTHLSEVARSLMLFTSLPSYPCGDVVLTATHLINQMSSHVLHLQTPLECLKEFYPSISLICYVPLQVFEFSTYVHNHGPNQTKFTSQAQACVLARYFMH